jgi:hypothetical protein
MGVADFKGKSKVFVRTYGFLASILPYTNADWEKLSRRVPQASHPAARRRTLPSSERTLAQASGSLPHLQSRDKPTASL